MSLLKKLKKQLSRPLHTSERGKQLMRLNQDRIWAMVHANEAEGHARGDRIALMFDRGKDVLIKLMPRDEMAEGLRRKGYDSVAEQLSQDISPAVHVVITWTTSQRGAVEVYTLNPEDSANG